MSKPSRPKSYAQWSRGAHGWKRIPLLIEWSCEWAVYRLRNWAFVELLELLGRFTVLVAFVAYLLQTGDRIKQRHYQAWQVIIAASGKKADSGRSDAIRDLVGDGVALTGIDLSDAILKGLDLRNSCSNDWFSLRLRYYLTGRGYCQRYISGNLQRTELQYAKFQGVWFVQVDFRRANLQQADFRNAVFGIVHMDCADIVGAHFEGVDLSNAKGLTQKQIDGACLSATTKLPPGLRYDPSNIKDYCQGGYGVGGGIPDKCD